MVQIGELLNLCTSDHRILLGQNIGSKNIKVGCFHKLSGQMRLERSLLFSNQSDYCCLPHDFLYCFIFKKEGKRKKLLRKEEAFLVVTCIFKKFS